MKTFLPNTKSLGNCSTLMVFPPTCSINLFATSSTVPKKIVYFCLPFTGSHSLQIRTQISRRCCAAYPHLNVRFVFRSSTRLSSFFPFKDKVPKFLRSGVVYLMLFRIVCGSNRSPVTHQSI